jgi:large subunit ribosomal protein L6
MSRLAKKPIKISEETEISLTKNRLEARGPQGKASIEIPHLLEIKQSKQDDKDILRLERKSNSKRAKSLIGTYYSLISNLVIGVSKGHSKVLVFNGVGYQAQANNNKLTLKVGFSHDVEIKAPEQVKFEVNKNEITVKSVDKQLVGEYAAKIRKVRPVDPYVLKGIKYKDEQITQKEGKTVEKLEEA